MLAAGAASSLEAFLVRSLAAFLTGPPAARAAAVVSVGNDAADLDSIVSAMAFAEWQQAMAPAGLLYVPLAPFPRRDFRLRTDASLLFKHCAVPFDAAGAPASIMHLDEAGSAAAAWDSKLGVALLDHNACLPGCTAALGDRVVAIVDHHNDEKHHMHLADCEATPQQTADDDPLASVRRLREVDPSTGSTCSLLVELMGDDVLQQRPEALRILLLGTISVRFATPQLRPF